MILVSSAVGSKHYGPLLGEKATVVPLESADACFSGHGGITVGVEIKTVLDAVSCLYSGRLADEQIPKMRASYDVSYLVIEGLYRPDPEGILQYFKWFHSEKETVCGKWLGASSWTKSGKKPLMYSAFESWVNTLANLGGVLVRNTTSSDTTAALLLALWSWYQRESHQSYDVMHFAAGDGAVLSRPTMLRRMLALLPHVGWERSGELRHRVKAVEFIGHSGNVMTKDDWHIPEQIAEKSAKDIDRACHGEDD